MKVAVIIIAIGAALYYSLYGAGPLEGALKQILKASQGESQKSPATTKAEEMKSLAVPTAQHWKDIYRPSSDCENPATALKKLECKNRDDNARRAFERK